MVIVCFVNFTYCYNLYVVNYHLQNVLVQYQLPNWHVHCDKYVQFKVFFLALLNKPPVSVYVAIAFYFVSHFVYFGIIKVSAYYKCLSLSL